jgi:hypothetical protein
MKRKIESARHGGLRYSLIAGGVAAVAMGVAATPAFADVIVQRTTTYGVPPAVTVETPAPVPPVVVEAPARTITVTHPAPPTTYVRRTETYTTYVPAPPPVQESYVEQSVVQDTPKWDYSTHQRVQTAQVQTQSTQTRTVQHKRASPARCTCQPSQ